VPAAALKEEFLSMPVLSPADYKSLSALELLTELAAGRVGFDHSFLDAFLQDREAAAEALTVFVDADHEDDRANIEDQVFDLFRHIGGPKALDFFMRRLREQLDGVEDETIEAFADFGSAAVEPLLELYVSLEEEESGEVAFLLAALQVKDSRITEVLIGRLEYDAQDAAICLGIHGDPAARPALEELLAEVEAQPDTELLRTDLKEALERLSEAREATEKLPFNLYDHCDEFQPLYFEVMEPQEIMGWLDSPDARVRQAAADSIEADELGESLILALADRATKDVDLGVRCSLWRSVMLYEPPPALIRTVKERWQETALEDQERATLTVLLAKAEYNAEVKSHILDHYKHDSLRALALEAMWFSSDQEFLPLVQSHLEDEDVEIRRAAILGIGYFLDASSASKLIPSMSVEDLRPDAIYAYSVAHPGKVTRLTAQKVLKHVEQVAGGLDSEEKMIAMSAIDLRLKMQGQAPYFSELVKNAGDHDHGDDEHHH
jgi:hypothetical protein